MRDNSAATIRREYPSAPVVGVAGVVVSDGHVLLIRRGREPMLGAWSLPGGALELGETTSEGVIREVFEETGVRVRAVEIVTTLDKIVRDGVGRVQYHYVLIEWLCVPEENVPEPLVCGDDADAAEWVSHADIYSSAYGLMEPTLGVIERALRLLER